MAGAQKIPVNVHPVQNRPRREDQHKMVGTDSKLRKRFHRHKHLRLGFPPGRVHLEKVGFDLPQNFRFEVLLAAKFALLARDVIHDQQLAVMFVDVLRQDLANIPVSTETARFIHSRPRS